MNLSRRDALKTTALAGLAAATGALLTPAAQAQVSAVTPPLPVGPFTLPPLPYAPDALEPHLDARTMQIHHDKHHATYVNKLNEAVAKAPELAGKTLEDLVRDWAKAPEAVRTAVRNHGGGHLNHTLFWQMMSPKATEPSKELEQALVKAMGGRDAFLQTFGEAAGKVFGSGWAWLVVNKDKALQVVTTPNQDNPITDGHTPLLGVDVWEHAYYLKFQSARADYLKAWAKVIHWDFVSARFADAMK
jgi:Fe-Mn family superoxide dismutase